MGSAGARLRWASPCAAHRNDGPIGVHRQRAMGSLSKLRGGQRWIAASPRPLVPPPQLPFQRLALRSEPVHQSPIGLLIHPEWGLWHAYRGALALPDRIELPALAPSAHPCSSCALKPCLSSCPVQALRPGSFDVEACVEFVLSAAGSDCRERGCRARRSCPVGIPYRYVQDQARFHMRAFLRSVRE